VQCEEMSLLLMTRMVQCWDDDDDKW